MSQHRYTIGVDFGTESGRAVLVDVADGRELATAVHRCANGVIDAHPHVPDEDVVLDHDWALQDPNDYIATFQNAVPRVVAEAGVDPADVIGIGVDFTACTMLPTKADGTPLCELPEWRRGSRIASSASASSASTGRTRTTDRSEVRRGSASGGHGRHVPRRIR